MRKSSFEDIKMDNKLFETVNGEDLEFSPALQKAYVDFINEAFGFNESGEDFKKLLPKLFGDSLLHPNSDNSHHFLSQQRKVLPFLIHRHFGIHNARY